MAYTSAEARQELLDVFAEAIEHIGLALAALGAAYEQLDEHNADRVEAELFYAPTDGDQDPRHVGTMEPVWNLFDMTPEGRGSDWDEQLRYS